MSRLICQNIGKHYKNKDALTGIDLVLESGKIYGLIGRNGAGKTTLLSIMSSQNPASTGTVTLDGRNIWENEEALGHICFARELKVTGNSSLAVTKVKEYLRIAGAYLPNWDQAMADELVNKFNLDVKKKIGKLSKGMTSMLTIIVALASKADYTFMDEPVAGLDVVARNQFYRILLNEFTETGRTFVISTHIIEEAEELFEEVIMLKDGKLLLKENTQELLEHCAYVTGKAEDVDQAVGGLEIHSEEHIGRSKGAMVRLHGEEAIRSDRVTVQSMNLQKVFVALCGEEEM